MLRSTAKILSIVIVLAMVLGAFAVMTPGLSAPAAPAVVGEASFAEPERMDAAVHANDVDTSALAGELVAADGDALAAPGNIYKNGSIARFYTGTYGSWFYNDTNASNYMLFQKRAESLNCELWVATDLAYPAGDSRNAFTSRISINNSQAQYMVNQFQTSIYPKMTAFFGAAPMIDGENSVFKSMGRPYFGTNVSGRVMIMVFNIVDESYFDSTYPSYIAGYFSPSMDEIYDRNIIHVDCWDWANRTTGSSARPWVYESTVTHEYQHLLNNFFNPEQVSFINEGCSMYAEILVGYGMDPTYITHFFYTPDLSLTDWSQQGGINGLAPYGASGMFATYLADHFGPEMIQAMVHSEGTVGVDTVNFAFEQVGITGWDFNKVFGYWRLANLILSNTPGNGWFNYKSINPAAYGGPRINVWSPLTSPVVGSGGMFFGTTDTLDGYTTGIRNLGAYGTDYIFVQGPGSNWSGGFSPDELKFMFSGQPTSLKGWQMTQVPLGLGDVVWSDDLNHGMVGWGAVRAGQPNGTGWHNVTVRPGDYALEADGMVGSSPLIQNDRLFLPTLDLMSYSRAVLSFDLKYRQGSPTDYAYLAYSVNGGTYKAIAYWGAAGDGDFVGRVSLDITDLTGFDVSFRISFISNGDDGHGNAAYMVVDNFAISDIITTTGWWSDKGDQVDYSLYTDLDLSGMESAVLTLDTSWDIEPFWDFGFVQVSTDGVNWTSVANAYTTDQSDPSAMETIVANLPGITGSSDGYVSASWDLSEWAGQMVKVRLRYMTDWGTSLGGWFVKGADLNGEAIPMDAWVPDTPPMPNQWLVTLYFPGAVGLESHVYMLPIMTTLNLQETTQFVIRTLTSFTEYPDMYVLVSPTVSNSDYGFSMVNESLMVD